MQNNLLTVDMTKNLCHHLYSLMNFSSNVTLVRSRITHQLPAYKLSIAVDSYCENVRTSGLGAALHISFYRQETKKN